MIAVEWDAVSRYVLYAVLNEYGVLVEELTDAIKVEKGDYLEIWPIPDAQHFISLDMVLYIGERCGISEDELQESIARHHVQ